MPSAVEVVLAVAGPLAVAAAWILVRRGRASIWPAMGVTSGVLGALGLATGSVEAVGSIPVTAAVAGGLAAGLALYVATASFLWVAARWAPLARHTSALYEEGGGLPVTAAVAISVLVVVPGEEILWRGVILGVLMDSVEGPLMAAALAWAGYVAANAVSGSIPIVLGAAVGGAAWTLLAGWSGGIAAPLACHAVWTSLMIVAPPVRDSS